jgi:hypothetical protein
METAIEFETDHLIFQEEVPPMTLHILLMTGRRDGFVWVTERSAFLGSGHGDFATVEKIRHLKDQELAFSGWGDGLAIAAINEFADHAAGRTGRFSDENEVMSSLMKFANAVQTPAKKAGDPLNPLVRGLFVATLGTSPRIYRVSFWEGPLPPRVVPIYDQAHATAGDVDNPANLFVRYYYPRCEKSIEELLLLGVHTVRLAKTLNSFGVGDPDVWVCERGEFKQLTPDQIQTYVKLSESLDKKILSSLHET